MQRKCPAGYAFNETTLQCVFKQCPKPTIYRADRVGRMHARMVVARCSMHALPARALLARVWRLSLPPLGGQSCGASPVKLPPPFVRSWSAAQDGNDNGIRCC